MLPFIEKRLIYKPVKAKKDWVPAADPAIQDVWLTSRHKRTRIHAWWCPTSDAEWVVLYCHGNAGNLSQRQSTVRAWQEIVRASVLIFDYPGFGRSGGRPTEKGCYASAEAAYRWLTEAQGVPPDRLVLCGGSLGGAMAVELAVRHPHRALILINAFTCIPDMAKKVVPYLPSRWLVRTRYHNLAKLRTYRGPLFVIHGTADETIPFAHGERLFAACPSPHKRFLPVEGARHNNTATPQVYAEIARFLRALPATPG